MTYEYRVERVPADAPSLQQQLNVLGLASWELILCTRVEADGSVNYECIFKRELV